MRPPSRQYGALAQPLDEILGAPARVRILRALDDTAFPLAAVGLQKRAGLTYHGTLKAVAVLVAARIVRETPTGGTSIYSLATDHPFATALRSLFAAERTRHRAIHNAVASWADDQPRSLLAVWLFGSVARREDTFRSDIDLAVVAQTLGQAQEFAVALRALVAPVAERQFVRPTVVPYDANAVMSMSQDDPTMWENLTRDAVSLHGPDPRALHNRLAHAV